MSSELNRLLYQLWGKEKVDATVKLAGNQRIRPTAVQHAGVIMEIEKALEEKQEIDAIAKQFNVDEWTVRQHRDKQWKKKK